MRITASSLVALLAAYTIPTSSGLAETGVRFQSCGTEVRERIISAYQVVNARRSNQRDELTACLDLAYVVEHDRHGPQKIVSDLRRSQVTTFQCRNLSEFDANARAHKLVFKRGKMKIDRDFVRDNSREEVAGVIAHELMHNTGYMHSGNPIGSLLYPNTVPEQVEACVTELRPNPYRGPGHDYYAPQQMLGFGLDGENNYMIGWSSNGTAFAGSSTRIHNYRVPYAFSVAPGVNLNDIVGLGIDGENNTVFAWLRSGYVIAGSSDNLDRTRAPYRYSLPSGYTPNDIVGMAVDGENNYNFVWFRDGRVSAGTSNDLDKFRSPYRYSLPPGYTPNDIVGMALDGENNMIFAYYKDGKVSAGTSDDLDKFRAPAMVITGR